jgi:hypothetical protein
MIVMEHADHFALGNMISNLRHFCPEAVLALYNSGVDESLGRDLDILMVPSPRPYEYAKITSFFFEIFEWVAKTGIQYDYLLNMETDLMFIQKGFEEFLRKQMRDVDYMAPNLTGAIPKTSKWRPYRSLKPEMSRWHEFFGFCYLKGAFSPAQVFSRNYIETLLNHQKYSHLKLLLRENASFTLQEVLFPTLCDCKFH